MRFKERLKYLRKELHLKQDDLAQACGVRLTAISKYENEIIKPGFDMLAKIGLAYNVNLNWLINEIGSMFIETNKRRLVKNATNDFVVEVDDIPEEDMVIVAQEPHSMTLSKDLKVDYYGEDSQYCSKIYRTNGQVEFLGKNNLENNFHEVVKKITEVCDDKNKFEFVMTAIKALDNEEALTELKFLIKGMELKK